MVADGQNKLSRKKIKWNNTHKYLDGKRFHERSMTTHDRIVNYEKERNIHGMLSNSCVIQSNGERLVIDSERENNINLWILDRKLRNLYL